MTLERFRHCAVIVAVAFAELSCQGVGVPSDFRLEATYSPSWIFWCGWTTTVTSGGLISRQMNSSAPPVTRNLAKGELQDLFSDVIEEKLFEMAPRYSVFHTDGTEISLRIVSGGRSHTVSVYGAQMMRSNADVQQFINVWNKVVALLPPPDSCGGGTI